MNIKQSITELIGHTPLLELHGIEKAFQLEARLVVKLEYFNANQSSKDRTALRIIEDAERDGSLHKDDVIVETTSGNTGISLASIAAAKGYRFLAYMQDGVSEERYRTIQAFGCETIPFSDMEVVREALERSGGNFMAGLTALKKELRGKEGLFYTDQCFNKSNPAVHRETTGPEIWEDTDHTVDIVVGSVGTGGTISGIGQFLKSVERDIRIVAVEPDADAMPVMDDPSHNAIDGIERISDVKEEEIPGTVDFSVLDEIVSVSAKEAYEAARAAARLDGVLLGSSSGAAIHTGIQLARKEENRGKLIVVIAPDTGLRYLTTNLFYDEGGK